MNTVDRLGVAASKFYAPNCKTIDKQIKDSRIEHSEEIFDPETEEILDQQNLENSATTDEASIDESAEEDEDEIVDFTCAISKEKIQTPGFLSCGHFFELKQIDDFRKYQLKRKLPFNCPNGCLIVQKNIIESKQLRNGIEESSKKIAALREKNAVLKSSNSKFEVRILNLESKISDMEARLESKLESKFKKLLDDSVGLSNVSKEIAENSQKISEISSQISKQNDLLKEKDRIRKKQLKNAKPETLIGRVYLCVWPDSVLNNGISLEEKEILKKKGLKAEEMEALNIELDFLDGEREELICNAKNLEDVENSNQ